MATPAGPEPRRRQGPAELIEAFDLTTDARESWVHN
jgi:hypothetical protein